MGLPVQKSQKIHWKHNENKIKLHLWKWQISFIQREPVRCQITILCEFGGAEYRGDPEGFFGAPLEGQVGGQVGAAVEVFFTAGQAQVQALITKGGIFITLKERENICLGLETFVVLKRRAYCWRKVSILAQYLCYQSHSNSTFYIGCNATYAMQ